VSDTYFALDYSPGLLLLFRLLGMGPSRSGVWVGHESVRVAMGWGFRAEFPRRAVSEIGPDSAAVTGWGVHGWRGRWLVNGSSAGLVRLEIEPVAKAWVTGVPVQLRTLRLSLELPDGLTAMLSNLR
jgi:hypothetical protein